MVYTSCSRHYHNLILTHAIYWLHHTNIMIKQDPKTHVLYKTKCQKLFQLIPQSYPVYISINVVISHESECSHLTLGITVATHFMETEGVEG